jgi:hypothetical protein
MYERWDSEVRQLAASGVPGKALPDPNASSLFPSFERIFRLSAGKGGDPKEFIRSLMAAP